MGATLNEPSHGPSVEDQWFIALNERTVHAHGRAYRLRVEGVHQSAGEAWIQFAPMPNCEYGLVVHCWQQQSASEILDRLSKELAAMTHIYFVDATRPLLRSYRM